MLALMVQWLYQCLRHKSPTYCGKHAVTPQHSVSSIQQEIGSYWNNKNSEAHALWKDTNQLEKHIYISYILFLLLLIINI